MMLYCVFEYLVDEMSFCLLEGKTILFYFALRRRKQSTFNPLYGANPTDGSEDFRGDPLIGRPLRYRRCPEKSVKRTSFDSS